MGKIEILENTYQELDRFLILNSFCDKIGGDIKGDILLYCPVKSQLSRCGLFKFCTFQGLAFG